MGSIPSVCVYLSLDRGQGKVEELTAELSLLQENWRSEKEVQEQLAQTHTSLAEELKKEKVGCVGGDLAPIWPPL